MTNFKKVILPATIGNTMEWYDFALYSSFITIFSSHFFSDSSNYQHLSGFMLFSLAYIFRPLGGIIFGHIGDTIGRKAALSLSIMSMAGATFLIAFLPSYDSIGWPATFLVCFARIIQGLSIGGEYSGAITLCAEHAPAKSKNLFASISVSVSALGMLLGSFAALVINLIFTNEEVVAFAWRIPFLIGGLLGIVGLYLRKQMQETPEFESSEIKIPLKDLLVNYRKNVIVASFVGTTTSALYTIISTFVTFFVVNVLSQELVETSSLLTVGLSFAFVSCILSGWLTDKFATPSKAMAIASLLAAMFVFPAFYLIYTGTFVHQMIVMAILGTILGISKSAIGMLMYTCFPAKVRFSGIALANNMNAMLVMGISPSILYINCVICQFTFTPAVLYVITAAMISLVATFFVGGIKKEK